MSFHFTLVQQNLNPFACDLDLEVAIDCFVVCAQAFQAMVRVVPWEAPCLWSAAAFVSDLPIVPQQLLARLESSLLPRQTPTLVSVVEQSMKLWLEFPKRRARDLWASVP